MAVSLLDMILLADSEAAALEAWASIADSDGEEDRYARKAATMRAIAKTLDLVLTHRDAFMKICKRTA